jgi:hypothetical protein
MNNWYAIETEAAFRRSEWQRAVEADVRAARVCARPRNGRKHWSRIPHLSLATLWSRAPFPSPIAPRRRGVAC